MQVQPAASRRSVYSQNPCGDSHFFQCFTQARKNTFQLIPLANPQCNNSQGGCGQTSCNAACFVSFPGSP